MDGGFDYLVTMTDRLGADLQIAPCNTTMTAEEFAVIFFDKWYCENGLPLEIITDRDKLFISKFWKALHRLTGVKIKMSTAYHPETDSSSERTNKTVNQCLRYYVERNQKGWVRALPRVRFEIMNSVNRSTGFSNFQLKIGRSPRIIPPLVSSSFNSADADDVKASDAIHQLKTDVAEAQDALLMAKVQQAHQANKHRGPEWEFKVGDRVTLTTRHRRNEYKRKGEKCVAKFMPRNDGPYVITDLHPETSTYTLDLPNSLNIYPTFHASELSPYKENDSTLFPSRDFAKPGPVVTPDGVEEFFIDRILDSRHRGRGWQYLVRWQGYGIEDDKWLPRRDIEDTIALDRWLQENPQD